MIGSSRVVTCRTWDEFVAQVRNPIMIGYRLFRGHRDPSWKLSSKWERYLSMLRGNNKSRSVKDLLSDGAYEEIRDGYLERFKHWVWEVGVSPGDLSDDEWWALGRHHGLLTPLLDWTFSPYVAAYFAFMEKLGHHLIVTTQQEKESAVNIPVLAEMGLPEILGLVESLTSGLVPLGWNPVLEGTISVWQLYWMDEALLKEGELEMLTPRPPGSARQIRQRGAFTRLSHDVHLDLEAYLVAQSKPHHLERFDVPAAEYKKALADLRLMGIFQATLYQDLDGAAREANMGTVLPGWVTEFRRDDE